MDLPAPTPEDVSRFRALYEAEFGVELSPKEALQKCTDLFQFVYLVGEYGVSLRPVRAPQH